jgi:hypothetical protein
VKAIALFSKGALIASLLLMGCPAMGRTTSIFGRWERESLSEDGAPPASLLSLDLERNKNGDRIAGTHCYIYNQGRRIDCPDEDEENVEGVLAADETSARLRIRSSFADAEFAAIVSIEGEQLRFTLISSKGQSYPAPENVKLSRPRDDDGCAASVTVGKAFFHAEPSASARRSAYIVRGDTVIASRLSRDGTFVYASYVNDQDYRTEGWLRSSEIGPVPVHCVTKLPLSSPKSNGKA